MKKLPPITEYLAIAPVSGFSNRLAFTTSAIYQVQSVGLTPLQLVLLYRKAGAKETPQTHALKADIIE